jgi:hypothetical protein
VRLVSRFLHAAGQWPMLRGEFPAAYEISQAIMFGETSFVSPHVPTENCKLILNIIKVVLIVGALFLSACSGDP